MPRRDDIRKILLIGSGPIVIGQACEFDYSGTQGAKALREEGYEVILVNSNPATIMTDPQFAERTYVEPLIPEVVERILEREQPDALLPTLGGQTALNLALELHRRGVLERLGVELIGAKVEAIRKAEERELFKSAMEKIGLESARAHTVRTMEEAWAAVEDIGYPVILRPSLTMGGSGGGVANDRDEFDRAIRWAFNQSPVHECLVEESLLGWKEYELEVIRDKADNFAVICTIENFDPMGVHTGDSVTVAPAMTLTDREYQRMRDAGRKIITEIGVDTGGSNIQFAVDPETGRLIVIEMNPRVSRSSALASKATGYPIAKVAAKLAVGYTLDELRNDITGTSSAFEPTIDYVVTKWPRFAFEKFRGSDPRLTTQMKSVGEAMAIGKTFKESVQKAARSLEVGRDGLVSLLEKIDYRELRDQVRRLAKDPSAGLHLMPLTEPLEVSRAELQEAILEVVKTPLSDRLWYICDGLRVGLSIEQLQEATGVDSWFLDQLEQIVSEEEVIRGAETLEAAQLDRWKRMGFSDARIAQLRGAEVEEVRRARSEEKVEPIYARVDTCAAEFAALTPYLYSTWGERSESEPTGRKKVMILGGGPNRIGQGIEFDYCCVHAAFAMKELGYESIMVNCNPETVSTDYDTSDRLYFEPLTFEDVMAIVREENPDGVIVQFGGQTPLKLAVPLAKAGVPILGTSADAIDRAEDRERFDAILEKLGLSRPQGGIAKGMSDAIEVAERIGYPVVVRPSYVLGGRAMEIVYTREELEQYMAKALEAVEDADTQTILVDEFLKDAAEVDVDAISDGKRVVIGGVMQHIEEAGVHSGDSSMVLPAHALPPEVQGAIRSSTRALALELGVVGLMNVQFAVKGSRVYVIEVNPRASRTVPFIGKATGLPLANIAAKVMAGKTLEELGVTREVVPRHVAVKESVFPFHKFPGVDTILGPEMRSTGEVMGVGADFPEAFLKALWSASYDLPREGRVFLSVRDDDKQAACELGYRLRDMGFELLATRGTKEALARNGVEAEVVNKVLEGSPHIVDRLQAGDVVMVINTTEGAKAIQDSRSLRRETLMSGIPYFTTIGAATAAVAAVERMREPELEVCSLQEYHARTR
ncbi:MAG TPA: carbamoyl-phosphate synthase large subunit [Polyangiaceae bacterium LLY-WYZ-15_(1-7)]|nr:carbamoyl phosphate synthase large subunit [Myxococcales bacterium]MBJ70775.1 carbamoyl phosphate synthase large subunit [Sandaracinus sp.]HJL01925.1 carbamoyl-phosphate synthase large subunit [Polyangiaceae bacterium LLY-WYZ-15_(1-7)]HJL09542.1 carbamoyl-phosphate synthase large subunit [Polyangiaceae bacterium LLY-WYZ-15_(1-7)]HJL50043.1 carbamoyl-phosphate synthase large subunit [Polyangiaceae bacterium LLY-WYZ-15_(1-7)]